MASGPTEYYARRRCQEGFYAFIQQKRFLMDRLGLPYAIKAFLKSVKRVCEGDSFVGCSTKIAPVNFERLSGFSRAYQNW